MPRDRLEQRLAYRTYHAQSNSCGSLAARRKTDPTNGRPRRRQNVFKLFFFQAEDGIRDYKVTGVQTCALPICVRIDATCAGVSSCREPRMQAASARRSELVLSAKARNV